jgi:hypothetical protein
MNDKFTIIHCSVATLLLVMWHLDSMSKEARGDRDGLTYTGWPVVGCHH